MHLSLPVRTFVSVFYTSGCCMAALAISTLLAFSLSCTAGPLPEIVSDRYARLRYGFEGDRPCWTYTSSSTSEHTAAEDTMPRACIRGADDAQTASAYGSLVMNGLIFLFNPSMGSATDRYGRRIFLMAALSLSTLSPAALLLLQFVPKADPAWYFAARATVELVDFLTITFAALSDVMPKEHRAGSFAVIIGGFYSAYAFGPSLAVVMSHEAVSLVSWIFSVVAFVVGLVFFPETLPSRIVSTIVAEDSQPTPPSTAFLESVETVSDTTLDYPQQQLQLHQREDREAQDEEECNTEVTTVDTTHVYTKSALASTLSKPFRDVSILNRSSTLQLIALGSFLAATVFNTDHTLVMFYIEEHLNVKDDDVASMFFVLGILGEIMQCFALQPLLQCMGERGLLILTFISGTIHNFIYGAARKKQAIYAALALSQVTKLNYPILSSIASQEAQLHEQGQVQGALLALNALAGALGPLAMNGVYEQTKDGTMFLVSSALYFAGFAAIYALPRKHETANNDEFGAVSVAVRSWEATDQGSLAEPLLMATNNTNTTS